MNGRINGGTRVYVSPGFTHSNGTRGDDGTYANFQAAYRDGGYFWVRTGHSPDSDGDYRVSTSETSSWESSYVHKDYVELAYERDATPATATPTVSVEDAFKPGNEIEFSVSDMHFGSDGWSIGCKAGNYSDTGFMDSVIKLDRQAGTATFKATINPAGNISIPGGALIDRWEAADHFKDVKITKLGTPPRPDATVTLTADEMDVVKALVGRTRGTGPQVGAWGKLNAAQPGDEYRQYDVTDDGRRITKG